MKCDFCVTGTQKLERHLEAGEIIAQVYAVHSETPLSNIVFMGMGEPLHNVDAVISACKILMDPEGFGFSRRRITVSTCGIVPAIERLAGEVGVKLAVSLNAPTDEKRSNIMPINKKWNIDSLLSACQNYPSGPFRMVTYEYVLLKGVNDSIEDAKALVKLMRKYPAKVNVIPFNPSTLVPYQRPGDDVVDRFHQYLVDHHITATVRQSRGNDIDAACGQLRSRD